MTPAVHVALIIVQRALRRARHRRALRAAARARRRAGHDARHRRRRRAVDLERAPRRPLGEGPARPPLARRPRLPRHRGQPVALSVRPQAPRRAINATILVTTVPVFTVLGSVLIGREPPSALKFAGIGLCRGRGHLAHRARPALLRARRGVRQPADRDRHGLLRHLLPLQQADPGAARLDHRERLRHGLRDPGRAAARAHGMEPVRRRRREPVGVGLGRVHRGGPDDLHLPAQHLGPPEGILQHGGGVHLPAAAAHGHRGSAGASGRGADPRAVAGRAPDLHRSGGGDLGRAAPAAGHATRGPGGGIAVQRRRLGRPILRKRSGL
ncbi:MAG: DMT family transporter [Sphingobacterium sp.]|nr:DMT family transporter [Sphingobacterium sp.]